MSCFFTFYSFIQLETSKKRENHRHWTNNPIQHIICCNNLCEHNYVPDITVTLNDVLSMACTIIGETLNSVLPLQAGKREENCHFVNHIPTNCWLTWLNTHTYSMKTEEPGINSKSYIWCWAVSSIKYPSRHLIIWLKCIFIVKEWVYMHSLCLFRTKWLVENIYWTDLTLYMEITLWCRDQHFHLYMNADLTSCLLSNSFIVA